MRNKYIVCLLSLGIIISVIYIGIAARKSLSIYKQESIPVISQNHIAYSANDETDYREDGEIISMQLSDNSYNKLYINTYDLGSYLTHLENYISTLEDELSDEKASKKDHILQRLMIIANLEKKNDIQQMSIDGREIAISLIKNIYEIYGAQIIFGMDGKIQSVEDKVGNTIYQSADKTIQMEVQIIHLAIVVCIIVILFGLSIILAKKNNIFVKDGKLNGLDEKRYA